MNLTELGAALGPFFDISGSPSHQQLRDAFTRHGLGHLDPAPAGRTSNGSHLGKMKRIRHVLRLTGSTQRDCRVAPGPRTCCALSCARGFNPDSELWRQRESDPTRPGLRSARHHSRTRRVHPADRHRQPQRHRTHSGAAQLRRQNQFQPRRRTATGRHGDRALPRPIARRVKQR